MTLRNRQCKGQKEHTMIESKCNVRLTSLIIIAIAIISLSCQSETRDGESAKYHDKFGVEELYPSKDGALKWYLPEDGIQTHVPGEYNEIAYSGTDLRRTDDGVYVGKARVGGLASGGTQLTFRFHVTPHNGPAESDHGILAERGYMVSPNDWKNVEQTGYFKIIDPLTLNEEISFKLRGGSHNRDNNGCEGASYGVLTPYTTERTRLLAKEYSHPNYVHYEPELLYDYESIVDRWVGVKAVIYNLPNGDVKIEQYMDVGRFDPDTGMPANEWKKISETIDDGNLPGTTRYECNQDSPTQKFTWGGKTITWRIDQVDSLEFKYLSIREIDF